MIYQSAPFSMTVNGSFQCRVINAEYISNSTRQTYLGLQWITSKNLHTHPTHQCNFKWPWAFALRRCKSIYLSSLRV